MALGRRFGCAPTFLTFAIDDVNNISSIRLTTPGSGNTKFPSQVSGEIYEALRNGYNVEGSIPIPKTYLERLTRLTENPVGAALIYKSFVNDVTLFSTSVLLLNDYDAARQIRDPTRHWIHI